MQHWEWINRQCYQITGWVLGFIRILINSFGGCNNNYETKLGEFVISNKRESIAIKFTTIR